MLKKGPCFPLVWIFWRRTDSVVAVLVVLCCRMVADAASVGLGWVGLPMFLNIILLMMYLPEAFLILALFIISLGVVGWNCTMVQFQNMFSCNLFMYLIPFGLVVFLLFPRVFCILYYAMAEFISPLFVFVLFKIYSCLYCFGVFSVLWVFLILKYFPNAVLI